MAFIQNLKNGCQTMQNGNLEFSWVEKEMNGIKILPKVRQQEGDSCVFQALCSGTEMAIKRVTAMNNPPGLSDIEFSANSFVEDYESHTNRKLADESAQNLGFNVREETAISLFRNDGVLATSSGWEGEKRVKLTQALKQRDQQFGQIARLISNGKPVVGSLPVASDFHLLQGDDIYEFPKSDPTAVIYSHMVLFVGFGFEGGPNGRTYLVFLNSHGEGFGQKGFGRVYFEAIYRNCLYVISASAPKLVQDISTSSTPKRGSTEDPDNRPAQRQRLDGAS